MAAPTFLLRHRGSRLGRRIILLFLLAAMLPLAISNWVSVQAVSQTADRFDLQFRSKSTKQVGRQVYERLLVARALLAALPATVSGGADGQDAGKALIAPATRQVFLSLVPVDDDGALAWPLPGARTLPPEVLSARPHATVEPGDVPVALIATAGAQDGHARLWMVRFLGERPRWIAELRGDALWSPVADAGDEASAWLVRDAGGRVLLRHRGGDFPPWWALPSEGSSPADAVDTGTRLFMDGAFAARDWEFLQRSPRPPLDWKGLPLAVWLAGVALATLLAGAWLGSWHIRRLLTPLQQLTDGTRRLAEGAGDVRVETRRDDEIGLLAASFNDMALRLQARKAELEHRASHDSLTGLANRYGLHQALDARLGRGLAVAVLFIDLDHFKDVNDTRGHAAGDALLCQAADRLRAVAPTGALVARQGGDEFAMVLDGNEGLASTVATQAIAALSRSFRLTEGEHVLGASIGIALSPAHGVNREDLLRCADVALYDVKARGRGRHRVFTDELDHHARDRIELVADLRQALARHELIVHYQPRVDPRDGRIRSAEALVRWQHPTRGLLFPGAFIGLAESSGLIDALGQEVLSIVCEQLGRWHRQALPLERVSVNLSPQQLDSGGVPQQVRMLLDRHAVPASLLELEVTESLLAGDHRKAHAQLAEMRAWGVQVALDDFGTGYSSMSTLHQLPIDVIKVDRSFVTNVCRDSNALAITSAVVALARAMNLHLVAEGVEEEAQARLLHGLGCDELQGFLYSRAIPAEDLERMPGLRFADTNVTNGMPASTGPKPVGIETDAGMLETVSGQR
jgi:diguanylate cyclase (GGDEF)-like protein